MKQSMDWLNFNHLQCFWLIARRGGLSQAAAALRVSAPTVWVQMKTLEESLNVKLFEKRGRKLHLTVQGERIARVADEIFSLSKEIVPAARGQEESKVPLKIGVFASLPRLVTTRILNPVLQAGFRIAVRHGGGLDLLGDLAAERLDVLLADEPPLGAVKVKTELLGSACLEMFCTPALHRRLFKTFPQSLHGAPIILPPQHSDKRQRLDAEFVRLKVKPLVVAEVDDSALLKTLAAAGVGVIPAPDFVQAELRAWYGLLPLGKLSAKESYFLSTVAHRGSHAAVQAMLRAAHQD
jgi:LysR family transcriptional regulator, transcriptional activator of nhaA